MWRLFLAGLLTYASCLAAQETHSHGMPEKLGEVSFPVSCNSAVQQHFNRAVALLHSFAYAPAETAFRGVAKQDPQCAIAHWGIAMTHFHQLWEPPLPDSEIPEAKSEIKQAQRLGSGSERERKLIAALSVLLDDASEAQYRGRAMKYLDAMTALARDERENLEVQVFYALALLSTASPADKTHANQKKAADLLEPLYRVHPQHPGIPHYLIHAYDNAELASRGLAVANAYSNIAPSAPHALHMPSHIFTRLGLWDESITSNLAARDAAHRQGDTGEELHAMDYLVYAYLQSGRDPQAAEIIHQLKSKSTLAGDFKSFYAATAMPVRYAVELHRWDEASAITAASSSPPEVAAVAIWARGLGLARRGRIEEARAQIDRLAQIESQLRSSGQDYWVTQTSILGRELTAWCAQQQGKPDEAVSLMRQAADEEDAVEKLPITPGPIVPAREQLGSLLLEQNHPELALKEFQATLANAPGRLGAARGAAQAAELLKGKTARVAAVE
ncbi:MAG: hypothetical protein DMG62_00555 [Acidobacteria bacterium]|nr:MAG: hypothetical protein DMG62_00555 [Acidobacteriota bacterium]